MLHDIPHMRYESFATTMCPRYPDAATTVLALLCTLLLSFLSYHFFESPFLLLKNRWAPARTRPAQIPLSAS